MWKHSRRSEILGALGFLQVLLGAVASAPRTPSAICYECNTHTCTYPRVVVDMNSMHSAAHTTVHSKLKLYASPAPSQAPLVYQSIYSATVHTARGAFVFYVVALFALVGFLLSFRLGLGDTSVPGDGVANAGYDCGNLRSSGTAVSLLAGEAEMESGGRSRLEATPALPCCSRASLFRDTCREEREPPATAERAHCPKVTKPTNSTPS